jgi:glutaconate CoA-transferase, subunit B
MEPDAGIGDATPEEHMVVAAARELRDGECAFVGVGTPIIAALLAQRCHAPEIELILESGVVDTTPTRLPMSVGDPGLVTGSVGLHPMIDVFTLFLQGGLIDVGVLSAAQVDRFANLNSTVIGSYERPRLRLTGAGGAPDIMAYAGRIVLVVPHEPRRLVERVDFVTCPGTRVAGRTRDEVGLPGGGPAVVVTSMGVLHPDRDGELVLTAVHEGRSVAEVREATGWDLEVASELDMCPTPTPDELRAVRAIDPEQRLH